MRKRYLALMFAVALIIAGLPFRSAAYADETDYGVFLSVTDDLDRLEGYKTVVIDAQYFDEKEIRNFRKKGHKVYSYINVGSLENFRDYYDTYKGLALGNYEHWDEEVWIDVSSQNWQSFILKELAPELLAKGIDGFFVDNCDVYYNYPKSNILNGVTKIMKGLVDTGKAVIINGGDVYLDTYCKNGGKWNDVITGINQESVFSKIIWETGIFSRADEEEKEYFCSYVERYGRKGADIYLLEYTTDASVIRDVDAYCKKNGFHYYASDSLELDEP